ncbi:hypothetical protein [Blattabacterium sp. (Cryptocercus kyebangensis)]|uniref:hypothetical protein n=1 Tax=Blattabacterium sp. (Cryptocercus kyebangensis) TaxID=298656 RepID=UPI001F231CEE|nr:hypothetical protein [Blattabacterium sp. (Cryptocercus kyebangensis)]
MIKKIDQIIQYLLMQKKYLKKKLILISFNDSIIEYIKKKHQFKKNIFTEIYTIEQFIEKISGLYIFHKSHILFHFFYLLKKENSDLSKKFNDFLKWAPNILNDFQDLDLNLINIEYFFSYIISTEKIKKWNPNLENNLIEKKNYFFGEKFMNPIKFLKTFL